MRFAVASEISYAVNGPSTLILNVHAMRSANQMILEESFVLEPKVKCEEFVLEQGLNRFVRIETGAVKELKVAYRAVVETQVKKVSARKMNATGLGKIDRSVIPFLYPSRYCQSDKLGRLAFGKFGQCKSAFEKVTAITEWIHNNVEYVCGSTNWQTSAYDTVTERAGVCRDFAHLGIALCRALNIPARYFTGYAYQLNPPDFHACFEAYVGRAWLLFDATGLAPLNGVVKIATGRDAADASIATIFGPTRSKAVQVSCDVIGSGFKPLGKAELRSHGICTDGG